MATLKLMRSTVRPSNRRATWANPLSHRSALVPMLSLDVATLATKVVRQKGRHKRRSGRFAARVEFQPQVAFLEQRTVLSAVSTLTAIHASVASALLGQPITLTATVSDIPGGGQPPTGGTVNFSDQNGSIASVPLINGVATLTTSNLTGGTYTFNASYGGDVNFGPSASGTIVTAAVNGSSANLVKTEAPSKVIPGAPSKVVPAPDALGVVVDSRGDLFIADQPDNEVREVVKATGQNMVVAGTGTAGYSGDNGPATDAELDSPLGLSIDSAGNLFIADTGNNVIREVVNATGEIITFAGNGTSGYSGDNGLATDAELQAIRGIAVDAAGDLFIADGSNDVIREVDRSNGDTITTIAGVGAQGSTGYNGPATEAMLEVPADVAVDSEGNVFISDEGNNLILELDQGSGLIFIVAGNGLAGYTGDNGLATVAKLNAPIGVAVDSVGDLFIADCNNNVIREVVKATGDIFTVAGNGQAGYSGDGGTATAAELDGLTGVAIDSVGDLYIADGHDNVVRQATPAAVVSIQLSTGPYTLSYSSGVASALGTSDSSQSHSFVIEPLDGFLYYNVDNSGWSGNWGGSSIPVSPTLVVDISVTAGDGSSLTLGTPTGPAGGLLASFNVAAAANTSDTLAIDDSTGTTLASPVQPYTVNTDTGFRTINGPGISYTEDSSPFEGGVTLLGSAVNGDTYSVLSVLGSEPVNLITGSAGNSTVNAGSAGTLDINSALAITSSSGRATININDQNHTNDGTATLDDLSGNASASYEVTGLSTAPIEYGADVTALNIYGGTDGGSGVVFDINNTQSGTQTTIHGGANTNAFNLSDPSEIYGLSNLLGPVVVDGGGAGDSITLNDHGNDGLGIKTSYVFSDTVVQSTGAFAGLTYQGIGAGALTLDPVAPLKGASISTLQTPAPVIATINIEDTADSVTTVVNDSGGYVTTNVNNTGSGGTLTITTGMSDGNTVNVIANNEPMSIVFGDAPEIDAVDIGSTGGNGTMAGIQGAINISDDTGAYALSFHDENDPISRTWTLNSDDGNDTASVALSNQTAPITYVPSELLSPLTLNGGSGGNTFVVNNTTKYVTTDINTGAGNDTVDVFATGGQSLNIEGQSGSDNVTLGALANIGTQSLSGVINVTSILGVTGLTLDDSENSSGEIASLSGGDTTRTVTGLSPATINYDKAAISRVTIIGGSGGNTLNDDASGAVAEVVGGALPGETLIATPGSGTVDAINFQQINMTHAAAPPPVSINTTPLLNTSIEGFPFVDALAGTFTFPITSLLADASPPVSGLPASRFMATVNWGDGTSTAGTITADASDPRVYDVTGNHNYAEPGIYRVAVTVTVVPGSITGIVNGTTVTVSEPSATTTGISAVSNVRIASIAVSANPIVGVRGGIVPSAPVACVIDLGGPGSNDPASDFSANISVISSTGRTLLSVAAANITQNANSNSYTVTAPTLPLTTLDVGTYSLFVTVKKQVNSIEISGSGGALLIVASTPMTAGSPLTLSTSKALRLNNVVVGRFSDSDKAAATNGFTALIDWGDGSANFRGVVVSKGRGRFSVKGTHEFAHPGKYAIRISVTHNGGSAVSLTGTASIGTKRHA